MERSELELAFDLGGGGRGSGIGHDFALVSTSLGRMLYRSLT